MCLLAICVSSLEKCLFKSSVFFFFFFKVSHQWHMEFPRLGVESKLQLLAYATATAMPLLHPKPQPAAMPDPLTNGARPGIKPTPSWTLFRSFFFFFFFLGPYQWHMEIPKLGVKLEPQLPAYITATATPDIQAMSAAYTIPHSNAGSLIH